VDAERGRAFAELIETGKVDVVLFTSSSTVDSVVSLLGERAHELLTRVALASIGPITSRTLSVHGLHPQVTAERYTVEGLLDALEHHFA
jgi:uroporphyrinogen III methyltransferase/synthase